MVFDGVSETVQSSRGKLYWSTLIHERGFTTDTIDTLEGGITVLGDDIVPLQPGLRGGRVPGYLLELCGRDQAGYQRGVLVGGSQRVSGRRETFFETHVHQTPSRACHGLFDAVGQRGRGY